MKRTSAFLFAICALSACMSHLVEIEKDYSREVVLYAHIDNGPAKTIMDNTGKISWLPKDSISLFYGNYPYDKSCLVCSNEKASIEGTFQGTINNSINLDKLFAVYPYNDYTQFISEDYARIHLPDNQIATAGSFNDNLFISVASGSTNSYPNLYFENVCGGIGFTVTHDNVKTVSLKGNVGEPLGGDAFVRFGTMWRPFVTLNPINIDPSNYTLNSSNEITLSANDGECLEPGAWYYIVTYPHALHNGFTLTITLDDGSKAKKKIDKSVVIKSSSFGLLHNIDKELDFRDIDGDLTSERDALIELYKTGEGSKWPDYISRYWCSDQPVGNWGGIVTDQDGYVRSIDISGFNGTIPESICNLKHLEFLSLRGNFCGKLPSVLSQLNSLKYLIISSGTIPSTGEQFTDIDIEWGNLVNLKSLHINGQTLYSPIPQSIYDLQNIEVLDLSDNQIIGTIDRSINRLKSIIEIDLNHNRIDGEIPSEICELSKLKTLNLSANMLSGPLPENIGDLSSLESLIIVGHSGREEYSNQPDYTNNISGPIPSSIGKLAHLKRLLLSENHISGEIPDVIWGLPELEELRLAFNNLTGTLSSSIANAKKLQILTLGSNLMYGYLPDEIWSLNNLTIFDSSNWFTHYGVEENRKNHFEGEISSKISNLTNLTVFNITNCDFTGEIPASITSLSELMELHINNNNITGTIPDGIKDMKNLRSLWCQGNKLSGKISNAFTDIMKQRNSYYGMQWIISPQQEGYYFDFELYESTNYSCHKEIKVLQTATSGKGIDVVLMGDAFVDKDINDGTYDKIITLMYDSLFEYEPYKSNKQLFNVYEIVLVSKNSTEEGETALGIAPTPGFIYSFSSGSDLVVSTVNELLPNLNINDLTISIATPLHADRNGCCFFYGNNNQQSGLGLGIAISYYNKENISESNEIRFKETVRHETCGHGFGKLADEYVYPGFGLKLPETKKDLILSYNAKGWYLNVSTSNENVLWNSFLHNPIYIEEGIGIYEGACEYDYNIWRPSLNSIMRSSDWPGFNAPSREIIYRRMQQIAYGVTPTFEEFVSWDIQHKQPVNQAALRRAKAENITLNPADKPFSDCVIVVE